MGVENTNTIPLFNYFKPSITLSKWAVKFYFRNFTQAQGSNLSSTEILLEKAIQFRLSPG